MIFLIFWRCLFQSRCRTLLMHGPPLLGVKSIFLVAPGVPLNSPLVLFSNNIWNVPPFYGLLCFLYMIFIHVTLWFTCMLLSICLAVDVNIHCWLFSPSLLSGLLLPFSIIPVNFSYVTSRSWGGMGLCLPGYLVYYLPVLSIFRPTQRCCFYVVMGRMSQSVLVIGVIQLCMVQILHHHLLAILTFSCILAEPMTSRVCKNCTYV